MSGNPPKTLLTGDSYNGQPLMYTQSPGGLPSPSTPLHKQESYFDNNETKQRDRVQRQSTVSTTGGNPNVKREPVLFMRIWNKLTDPIDEKWTHHVLNNPAWPRFLYCLFGIIVVGAWFGVTAGFARNEQAYQDQNIDLERAVVSGTQRNGRGDNSSVYWSLEGRLQQFDPNSRVLSINWALKAIQNGQTEVLGEHILGTQLVGIFRDQDLVPVNQNYDVISPNSLDDIWDLRIANETALPIAIVGRTQWDSFSTDIDMGQRKARNPVRQPQFGFPFDLWSGSISFVANFWEFSKSINSTTAGGMEIDNASLVDSIMNWRITVVVNNTCVESRDGELTWVALEPCGLYLTLKARRTGLVKFASIVAVIVNWFSTLFIFIMTCEGVLMQRFKVIMEPQLLAVCFTALFALPTVRSILPGAPDFGALIDLVGIVPNVIIISLCTTLVAISTLKKITKHTEEAQVNPEETGTNNAEKQQ
ncbi:hypothetical protein CPB86DRAFT_307328 [Serendipita vermifera]|nr:hypothetical protein CPB86DRAFT_307328 [Serendipita vermifera]